MYKVLIVEDHPLVVEGLIKIIESSNCLSFAGEAGSADECLEMTDRVRPDIILLDINLPGMSGIELCKIISNKTPRPKVIALSTYSQRYIVDNMLSSGADGYLLKNTSTDEILNAIEIVLGGQTYLCDEVKLMFKKNPENPLLLSGREIEVLRLIARGFTNKEIADKLFISALTVDSHRKNMIQKMGVKNTAALVSIAGAEGII